MAASLHNLYLGEIDINFENIKHTQLHAGLHTYTDAI